ncbi:MAG: ParA family protein [Desulfobacterales bacterium]|nr:ParA family protein [Desulfobacterales bacterium]MBF0397417.1 ParA family protein [Desulfobacterales bacterium]
MTHIICIANQKGGVGKTTTAINLASSLAALKKRTLLLDCDPQANATTGIGINKNNIKKTLYHGLIGEAQACDIILDSEMEFLKIIPSRTDLIGFEVEMISFPNREKTIKNFLSEIQNLFDYIIIDCPPSLSLLTVNAMTAANYVLIPLQCEFYALEGVGQLLQTVKRIKQVLNPKLKIAGILLTMFDKRTNLANQVVEDTNKYFGELVFKTLIPRNVRLGEAPSFGKPILLYDPSSIGTKSYSELALEIINKMKE